MADWVHCNQCFRQPGDGRKFSLTNCGHTYCQNCLEEGKKDHCKLCGNPCTTILLTSKMKPDVEKFFCDPADLVKRHQTELAQVMSFQKSHRQRLTSFNRQKIAKQTDMLLQAGKMTELFKEVEKECQRLRDENAYLKKLIGSMGGSQAGRGPSHPVGRVHGGIILSQRAQGLSPSPSSQSSDSPHHSQRGHTSKSPYAQDGVRYSPMSQQGKRLSVRPPPTHGKIGSISRTPSPNYPSAHAARTPGSGEAAMPHSRPSSSPMTISPNPITYHVPMATGDTPNVPIGGKRASPASVAMFATPPQSRSHCQDSISRRLSASAQMN